MCSQPFQARIASIIPTAYSPAAHGSEDPPVRQPDEFEKAIQQIVGAMAAQWADVSHSSIEIAHRSAQVKTEVKSLDREGRIKEPPIDVFIHEASIGGAMVHCVWTAYPNPVPKLPEPNYRRKRMWIPCREQEVLDAAATLTFPQKKDERTKNMVRRVRHEFKHWLIHAVSRMMDRELDKKDRRKLGLSKEEMFKRFDPHIIGALSDYFDYDAEWAT